MIQQQQQQRRRYTIRTLRTVGWAVCLCVYDMCVRCCVFISFCERTNEPRTQQAVKSGSYGWSARSKGGEATGWSGRVESNRVGNVGYATVADRRVGWLSGSLEPF